ncbi:MAG: transcriptional regulator, partial [Clostridiales bacterium]|nr:transcriptional regulator [Clostridiales bacterium]
MDIVFLKILNMSIPASWLILAVIILRLVLKKAPKAIICALWLIVAIRLICPFSFESAFSLIPSTETVGQDILYSQTPGITSGIPAINSVVNPVIAGSLAPEVGVSVNPVQIWTIIVSCIWVVGVAAMLGYAIVSYLRIKKKVREGASLRDNIWLCDHIDTPFILGVLHPRIYLPSAMGDAQSDYVVAHENAHLKRHDHWWKPLGFLLLTIYWFNPLCWLAYVLLCRDIEMACDEKVVKDWGAHDKKAYSEALLSCSVPRRMVAACPLAFGEVGVKERVKNVLNYKKPAF